MLRAHTLSNLSFVVSDKVIMCSMELVVRSNKAAKRLWRVGHRHVARVLEHAHDRERSSAKAFTSQSSCKSLFCCPRRCGLWCPVTYQSSTASGTMMCRLQRTVVDRFNPVSRPASGSTVDIIG